MSATSSTSRSRVIPSRSAASKANRTFSILFSGFNESKLISVGSNECNRAQKASPKTRNSKRFSLILSQQLTVPSHQLVVKFWTWRLVIFVKNKREKSKTIHSHSYNHLFALYTTGAVLLSQWRSSFEETSLQMSWLNVKKNKRNLRKKKIL